MRRSRLVVLALLLTGCVAALSGCSSGPEVEPALAARLESDTGLKWAVHLGEGGEVRFLAPERPVRVAGGTPKEMARAYVCEAGGIAAGVYCVDPARNCKKAGPTDCTAAIGPDGELVCE